MHRLYFRLGLALLFVMSGATMSCWSNGSSQEYSSVSRSAKSVRNKLSSYSGSALRAPVDVCREQRDLPRGESNTPEDLVSQTEPDGTPTSPKREGPDAGAVTVSRNADGWSIRSQGGTMAQLVRALESETDGRIVARGVGVQAPIYARVRGSNWRLLLEEIATSVGLKAIEADGVTLVTDAPTAAGVLRSVARKTGEAPSFEEAYIPTTYTQKTAAFVAEFALGCSGTILPLPKKDVMLVEDTPENIEAIRDWVDVLEAEGGELDRMYSRDRAERWGVPQPQVATCNVDSEAGAEEKPGGTAMGQLILERTLAEGEDVIVGCGSHRRVASNPAPVPQTMLVAEFLGLEKIAEKTWVSGEMASRTRSSRENSRQKDEWRVVRREPLSPEVSMLLTQKYGPHFKTWAAGWGERIILTAREGYLDKIDRTIAEYEALGQE